MQSPSDRLATFAKIVLKRTREANGIILEGTSSELLNASGATSHYEPKFSPPFSVKQLPQLHEDGRSYLIPEVPFGYNYNVGVLVTEEPNRPWRASRSPKGEDDADTGCLRRIAPLLFVWATFIIK